MSPIKPYLVVIEAMPDPNQNNPQLKEIGGANVSLWVFETTPDGAMVKAIRYVQSYGWVAKCVLHTVQPLPEQLLLMDTQTLSNYHSAELLGINAHFEAWPKQGRPGHYSVETLKKPPKE